MNFICATIELKDFVGDPINAYGLDYCGANAAVPANSSASEVRFRVLCYSRSGPKLQAFLDWKPGTRALITGNLVFNDDPSQPLDLIVTTLETNIPQEMYCNQVILGNAFFGKPETIKERDNGTIACKIGTTLDNSEVTTWLWMETHASRKEKFYDRHRSGRHCCIQGYIREWRTEGDDGCYRAIVSNDFSTRKDQDKSRRNPQTGGSASGYSEVDPTPVY